MKKLSIAQEQFVRELVKGKSQREAYRIAFPNSKANAHTTDEMASKLFGRPEVRTRYDEVYAQAMSAEQASTIATAAEVLGELSDMAFGRKKFTQSSMFGDDISVHPSIPQRQKALELLGKHHKLFTDNVQLEADTKLEIVLQGELEHYGR